MVERRTLIVWSTLVASMTIASGLLMWLEPRPIAAERGLALAAVDAEAPGLSAVFNAPAAIESDRWDRIIVHHSGQMRGDAERIGRLHRSLDYDGLQFHFVIGNGTGSGDGEIELGRRWLRQREGVYAEGAISICLVGNGDKTPPTAAQMERLAALVRGLRSRLALPADAVALHRELAQTTSPGRLFPAGRFREMIH